MHQFHVNEQMAKNRCLKEMEVETEVAVALALSIQVLIKCNRKKRSEDEQRDGNWWINGYQNWDEDAFKKRCREILLNLSSVKSEMISRKYLLL